MTEFKGTKGDWHINRISGIATGIGVSKDVKGGIYTEMICEFFLPETDEDYYNSRIEADAKLIAAAPELLEVIQECDEYLKGNSKNYIGNGSILHRKLKQAINKAL